MASKRQVSYKCCIAGVVLLLLTSIAALIAVAVIQDTWSFKEYTLEYGIVIDSGSSRSNVYLYAWPGEKENETGVVTEIKNCRVSGDGISEMKVDPEKDAKSWKAFSDCMDEVRKAVPAAKHKTTPLFLGATAGMRLLRERDEQRSNEILASLREYLISLPFAFQNASIITGQEEGLYGWITVNYLMGNFFEKNLWNTYTRPEGGKTVGSMDLGGASTQIAFVVDDDLRGPNYMHIKLYGYPYNVYTHSFLCYGKNEAEKRILDKIVQESSNPTYIMNPCYAEGYNVTYNASFIYDTECTKKPKNYNPTQEIFMVGAPDSDKCGSIVKSIFDFKNCSSSHCSFDGVEQPPVTGEFMAYAGFFYTARALGINGSSDLDQFNSSVIKFCHTHWTVLKQEKTWISDRYLRTYCYAAHYIFSLLGDGYKFDKETWKNINFEKEVKKTSIGWSLGYMLSMSNMIPSEVKQISPMTNSAFAGLIFLFSALTIVTFIVVFIILVRTCY
ncbi:ectonucleoside triphosphate diphosphohydrolase 3 isoform X1 [Seriola lalandi dorsalis]|uniref:Ectonucleoside triphosphate diphosphohydrolase 3 n=2 Tax=Seriola lalandi dorsalis TaxID=1841481 RepID=A0A3B4YDR8_SERLL|nr:ectonucleoside triphosphate diphosphohydrolase 3 isoform X1 [Seriola lalandi dorsalis]XP_056235777.1 ectonucleoside triphosphate diphosphohydrolase 3 isoform X1 [Seriola aureovittata]